MWGRVPPLMQAWQTTSHPATHRGVAAHPPGPEQGNSELSMQRSKGQGPESQQQETYRRETYRVPCAESPQLTGTMPSCWPKPQQQVACLPAVICPCASTLLKVQCRRRT